MKVEKKVTEICGNKILKQRLSELVYYTYMTYDDSTGTVLTTVRV